MISKYIYRLFYAVVVLLSISASAQNAVTSFELKVKVFSEAGDPLENVELFLEKENSIKLSNENGECSLQILGNDILILESKGYHTQRLEIKDQRELTVILTPYLLNEKLIPLAYGQYNHRSSVSSISSIGAQDVRRNSVMRIEEALGGSLSGVYSERNQGEQFSTSNYSNYVRGASTTGSNAPLIIIDGVEGNTDLIDACDIENITILKDIAELAMYGMRGANGVILVTSKRGDKNNNYIKLNIRAGVQTPAKIQNKIDAHQYTSLHSEAITNDGGTKIYDPSIYEGAFDPFRYPDTDMPSDFLKDNSSYQHYNFTSGGGNRIAQYFTSVGYAKQDGLFKQANNDYSTNQYYNERFNFRTNLDVDLGKGFTFNTNLLAVFDKNNSPWISSSTSSNESANSVFNAIMNTRSNAYPIFNKDGSLGGTSEFMNNPSGVLNRGKRVEETRQLGAQVKLSKDLNFITKGLSSSLMYHFENYNSYYSGEFKEFAVYQRSTDSTYTEYGTNDTKRSTTGASLLNYYTNQDIQGRLDYERNFGKSSITGALMVNHHSNEISGDVPVYVWLGTSMRLLYGYAGKYYAQITSAYQGSNSYASGHRYDLFPSLGLAWLMSEENFLSSNKTIDYLKIKGSIGKSGNDLANGSNRFMYRQTYVNGGGYGFGRPNGSSTGSYEGTLNNPNTTWESAFMSNVGVEAQLFDNSVRVEAAGFYEKRSDIMVTQSNIIPSLIGISLPNSNAGIIKNKGLELSASYAKTIHEISFILGANATFTQNEIVDLHEQAYPYEWLYRKGHSIHTTWGYKTDGIYNDAADLAQGPSSSFGDQQLGDIKYINQNSEDDNLINNYDRVAIADPFPKMVYGFNLSATYKGFDFYCLAEGTSGATMAFRPSIYSQYAYENRWRSVDDGADALFPRLSQLSDHNMQMSDFWVEKANLFRISTIELGYNLSDELAHRARLSGIRLYVNASNLFSTSEDKEQRDYQAVTAGYSSYPMLKTWMMGITIEL